MLCGESSPVHAVFMSCGESSCGESSGDLTESAEALLFVLVAAPWFLCVRHDADDVGSESLHSRDGTFYFC